MKTTSRFVAAASVVLVLCAQSMTAEAAVAKRRDTERWFDKDGAATDYGKNAAAQQNLPPLISGVWIEMTESAAANRVDKIYVTRKAPCASVQFKIKADGTTDQFSVIESAPHEGYGQNVVKSMVHWKFAPGSADRWESIAVNFEESDQLTGSRLTADLACKPVTTQVMHVLAGERKLAESRPPVYPTQLAAASTAGCATIRFTVRPDGLADEYEVINAAPGDGFVSAAAQALNAWRFEPAADKSRAAAQFAFAVEGTDAPSCVWPF